MVHGMLFFVTLSAYFLPICRVASSYEFMQDALLQYTAAARANTAFTKEGFAGIATHLHGCLLLNLPYG